jgi:serine/threonine protein kinase/lipopolysaccharide biosynthesis regulator YciM
MLSRGQQLGKYKILSAIGSGGMGEVFLAEDTELERFAAIKILSAEAVDNSERIQRFIREAKATSALNHPNIVTIYEIGLVDGIRFIASEYVEGKTLREKLRSSAFSPSEMLEIALQITSALHIAHSANIIHRDIKPENIMLREDGLVKVLDFGLAKLTEPKPAALSSESPTRENVKTKSGLVMGTAAYMSPEQARGKKLDQRTDIFSLGIVFYEMLTKTPPFSGETSSDVIAAILLKEPDSPSSLNPEVPPELEKIILNTLAKNSGDRYQTSADLLKDLKELKKEIDFKSKLETPAAANEFFEANTEIIEAHTDNTDIIATDPATGSPSEKISFFKLTKKLPSAKKYPVSLFLILGLFAFSLLGYFLFSAVVKRPPKSEAVKMFNNGIEALRDGTFNKASKMLEDAIASDSGFTRARAGLAEAWMELDYFGRAQTEMLKVIELERQNRTFFSGFSQTEDSLYIEAIGATVRRDFPQAVKLYERIAADNPAEAYVYVDLGRAFEKNENIDKAIECYERATDLNPQYGAAFLRLGILYSRKTEYEKSFEAFRKAENIYDRQSNDEGVAEVKYQRGGSLNAQENLTAARAQFEEVINNPRANKHQQIKAMLQISSACSGEGKTACAEEYASKAINLAKNERMENVATNGLIDLGNSFLARGEYDRAEQNFQQALVFARNDEGLRNEARALLALGSLRVQQRKPTEAKDFVNQALPFFQKGSYNKDISTAYLILGRANEMSENYDEALQAFEQVENAENASPADKAYAKMVSGNVLMHREKYSEALRRFEQSNELYQSLNNTFYSTYIQFYLSDVLLRLGRFDEAKDKLFKAQGALEKGHSLLPTLTTKIQLLNSQIALSQKDFNLAIKEADQVVVAKDSSESFEAKIILGLAQTHSNPKNPGGVQNCLQALQIAVNRKDSRRIHLAKLVLAEAYFSSGNQAAAAQNALAAKDYFEMKGQLESGWRAWLMMAAVARQAGQHENARAHAAKALETLSRFEQDLGPENYKIYFARPDISFLFRQAESLTQS